VKIIFGLGNPGKEYAKTRHNAGAMVVERIAEINGKRFRSSFLLSSLMCEVKFGPETALLVKPVTYMNNSGTAVKKVLGKYKIKLNDVLVVYDDVALPLGVLRFRLNGSAGGQKGMASVIETVGTNEISRLRVGIDKPAGISDLADYVLADFNRNEIETVDKAIVQAATLCDSWVQSGSDYVIKNYGNLVKGGE